MSRIILVGLFFLSVNASQAQSILLLNASTNEPVEGAIVYAENTSIFASSDISGYVDVSKFNDDTRLVIQHPSFQVMHISLIEISNATVYLKEKVIRIDEVVISANKWEQNKSEIPFEIMSLNANTAAF